MESFPTTLHVSNKETFKTLLFNENLKRLRGEVMYHILHQKENDFFDLDVFNRLHVNDNIISMKLTDIIINELKTLGWNTYLGFGDTGLYIYSTDERPDSVY